MPADSTLEAVEWYLSSLPEEKKRMAQELRRLIMSVVPGAVERMSSGAPFYWYRGRRAVGFGAAKTHLSFFIMHGKVLKEYEDELADYDVSPTAIRFKPGDRLPVDLIRRLVIARLKELDPQVK